MDVVYLLRKKTGDNASNRHDTRKLLFYTSEGKAWAAVKARHLNADDYEVIAYVPKEETEND